MERPVGVKVVAVVAILYGALRFVAGLVLLILNLAVLPALDAWSAIWSLPASRFTVLGAIWGIGLAAAGIGLWKLRRWARFLIIGFCSVVLGDAASLLIWGYPDPEFSITSEILLNPWSLLLPWVLCGFCIAYLLTNKVRQACSS